MTDNDPKARLRRLLDAVFDDNFVDPDERKALSEMTGSGTLSGDEVRGVFAQFMEAKWGEALQDGVLSSTERALLSRIVSELSLPHDALPAQMRIALRDD